MSGEVVGFVGIFMLLMSVITTFRIYKKPRKLPWFGLIFSIFTTAISYIVYYEIYAHHDSGFRDRLNAEIMLPIVCIGLFVGLFWNFTNRLKCESGTVMSRGNVWYLLIWLLIFMFTQLIPMLIGRTPDLTVMLLTFSTGLLVTNNIILIIRGLFKKIFWKPQK